MKTDIPVILKELEDALEERKNSDRRSNNVGVDPKTLEDRRTGDRRMEAEKHTN